MTGAKTEHVGPGRLVPNRADSVRSRPLHNVRHLVDSRRSSDRPMDELICVCMCLGMGYGFRQTNRLALGRYAYSK